MPEERGAESYDLDEAVVASVGCEVAHDSDGLTVVTLRYPNGARTLLPLGGSAIGRIVREPGLESIRERVGYRFSALAPELPANRLS